MNRSKYPWVRFRQGAVDLKGPRYGMGMFTTIHKDVAGSVEYSRKFHEYYTGRYYGQCKTQVKS